ncbi:transcription factor bHLH83 [Brachypodium distachyon]|uniref:BHLH domain-containing protein n=1 Tax=Brachypodium distachyon TaxID=15368 RepID=I1GYN5_BRADI|nr:transcription factor bHLH83 [Brachypodium distachyon]KQK18433.1 hypothetical protein BRADI_1g42440v3 [Brachypodium distachyon]|eukprot:XP_010229851.1 transcription factor bHLH83 [Brachypodium distachyon]
MALVGQATKLCYDGFAGDGVPPFMDAACLAFDHGYDYNNPHAWEFPTGAEPGNSSAFDVAWTGVSSTSPVLTFDAAEWMDATATDRLSSYSPSAATVPASYKRPRAHVQPQQEAEEQESITPNPKKQCGDGKVVIKSSAAATGTSPRKEPQSQAAKSRRERIGERLRALQELVPNGSKVDMVTMLDKAITYVKFMQLQLTVLETDAFWPAQGGAAPEISQVKAALDAIILSSSQKPRQWS